MGELVGASAIIADLGRLLDYVNVNFVRRASTTLPKAFVPYFSEARNVTIMSDRAEAIDYNPRSWSWRLSCGGLSMN